MLVLFRRSTAWRRMEDWRYSSIHSYLDTKLSCYIHALPFTLGEKALNCIQKGEWAPVQVWTQRRTEIFLIPARKRKFIPRLWIFKVVALSTEMSSTAQAIWCIFLWKWNESGYIRLSVSRLAAREMETQFWWGKFMGWRKKACEDGRRMELAKNHAKWWGFRICVEPSGSITRYALTFFLF